MRPSQEEFPPCLLVRRAGAGQLGDVHGLADVVRGRSEENGRAVHVEARTVPLQPVDQVARHIVNRPQVGGRPRRRAEGLEEFRHRGRERPKGWIGRRVQGPEETV